MTRVARLCIDSILLMCFTKYGFQTWQPYSKIGRTEVLYAVETPSELFGPKVRLIRPRIFWALCSLRCLWNWSIRSLPTAVIVSSTYKMRIIKGEALRILRTSSVKEIVENSKRDFEETLCKRGYPITLVIKILAEVKFAYRKETLRNKTKQRKEILPFVTTYNPAMPTAKKILMRHWHIIRQQPKLKRISNQPPIVSYTKKEKSQTDILVRAKLPSNTAKSQNQRRVYLQTWRKFTYDHLNWLQTGIANI